MKSCDLVKNNNMNNEEIKISLDRDSVCMGDDCESHSVIRTFRKNILIDEFLMEISNFVPHMADAIWCIISSKCENRVIGYIIIDKVGKLSYEVNGSNETFECIFEDNTYIDVFCRYYYQSSFLWFDGETKQYIEKYSDCKTLLEKVKKECEK